VCKVFEIKELSVDFGFGYGTKVESPACAGLWFLPDLIVAAVSSVGGGEGKARGFEALVRWGLTGGDALGSDRTPLALTKAGIEGGVAVIRVLGFSQSAKMSPP
jgi:hypothetical protein